MNYSVLGILREPDVIQWATLRFGRPSSSSSGNSSFDMDLHVERQWKGRKVYMDVSKKNGTPKSSILIGFSIINHPFSGGFPPIFGNTHIKIQDKFGEKKFEGYIIFTEINKESVLGSCLVLTSV